MYVSDGE
jgi:hypothetical protein